MKETLVKVIALLGLVAILGLASCGPEPTTTPTSSASSSVSSTPAGTVPAYTTNHPASPYVTVVVGLNVDATNLYDAVVGAQNAIYMVGDTLSLRVYPSSNAIGTWNEADKNGQMLKDPVTGYYYITFYNSLTNDSSLAFKFQNGTPGFGGPAGWANEEQQFKTNAGFTNKEGINGDRKVDIMVGSNVLAFFTNDHITNVSGYSGGKIATWKGVGPTYSISNAIINLVVIGVVTNTFVEIQVGTNVDLYGLTNWSVANQTVAVAADSNVTFSISNFIGSGSAGFQLRALGKYFDTTAAGGGNFSFIIPISMSNGGTLTVTNTNGSWRN